MKTVASSTQVSPQQAGVLTKQEKQKEEEMLQQKQIEKKVPDVLEINLDQLVTPDFHPRTLDGHIGTLVASIQRDGLYEPLLVMKGKNQEDYIVLDGTRRKAALDNLGKKTAPCIIKSIVKDADAAHVSYVTNMERETLSPIEQAVHIKKMQDRFGFTYKELSVKGYGTVASISKKLKVLELPEKIQHQIIQGKLSEAHGRELLKLKTKGEQERMAEQAIESEISANKLKRTIKRYLEKEEVPLKADAEPALNVQGQDIEDVYFKDSRNMAEIPEKSIHLIVTSPPYGIGKEFEKNYSFETMFEETKEVFKECARVLVPGGIMAVNFMDLQDFKKKNGHVDTKEWLFTGPLIQKALRKHNIILTDVIQWVKPLPWLNRRHYNFNDMDEHTSYRIISQTEQVLILRKKGKREEPNPEVKLKSRLSKHQWRSWAGSVWRILPVWGQNAKGHPAVFPDQLCSRLIKMFSYEGDTILDPWLGSGTTVKVARELNRHGIGYERELKYKPVIMEKLGLQPAVHDDVQPNAMTAYVEQSMAETSLKEPKVTTITNMSKASLEKCCANHSDQSD